jgi:hypothetical protein
MRRVALLFMAVLLSACGEDAERSAKPGPQREAEPASTPTITTAPAPSGSVATEFYVASTRITGNGPALQLRIPQYGTLAISCEDTGHATVDFTVVTPAPSTVVVVHTTGGETLAQVVHPGERLATPVAPPPMQQNWQLTPIDPVAARVATIAVTTTAARMVNGSKGCFASTQAVTTTRPD